MSLSQTVRPQKPKVWANARRPGTQVGRFVRQWSSSYTLEVQVWMGAYCSGCVYYPRTDMIICTVTVYP